MALIDLKVILITALIFIPLERVLSMHSEQKVLRRHWMNDLFYLLYNGILIKLGMLFVIGVFMAACMAWIPAFIGETIRSQPLWLESLEAVLIADIGFYFAHRAFHTIPFLWKFHSVHHSIEEMDWLAAHRVHPLDQILTKSASMLPLFALGFSTASIAVFAVIYHWQSLLIHSNTNFKFGPLKWLFASPQFHHWHHANEKQAYDKNFAGQLSIIDMVAGTMYLPGNNDTPEKYGTDDPVPTRYDKQFVYPFLPDKSVVEQANAMIESDDQAA